MVFNEKLYKQLAEYYVQAMPDTASPHEKERLEAEGEKLLINALPLLQQLFFDGGLLPPYLQIYDGNKLPNSSVAFEVKKDEGGRPVFRIAIDAPDHAQQFSNHLRRYFQEGVSGTVLVPESQTKHLRADNYIPFSKNPSGSKSSYDGFNHHASGQPFCFVNGPDKEKPLKNNLGDINFYCDLRRLSEKEKERNPHTPTEWEFWRNYLLEDTQIERLPPMDWLRSLRILNGYSTRVMGAALGIGQTDYNSYENRPDLPFPRRLCIKCLEKNIFRFPTEPGQPHKVREDIVKKFLLKFGHYLPFDMEQLGAAIKARAIEEWPGNEQSEPMNGYTVARRLMPDQKLPSCIKMEEWQTFLSENNASDKGVYLYAAPHTGIILASKPNALVEALAKKQALRLAEQAQDIGDFLQLYLNRRNGTAVDLAKTLNVTRSATALYHTKKHLRPSLMTRIIDKNPYHFPTDASGAIHPEIIRALHCLNNGEHYKSPYISMTEAASLLNITVMHPVAHDSQTPSWATRILIDGTPYQTSKLFADWKKYWTEQEDTYKKTDKLLVESQPIRVWEDEWDHLLVHRDDAALLTRDFNNKYSRKLQRDTTAASR